MPVQAEPLVLPEALLAFLGSPEAYPFTPASIRVVQTHASYVALVPPYVYKVKKAVNLGFLDFSTLPLQRQACRAEIRLNRRLCPDLYMGLVPITRAQGQLHFAGAGPVVAYAVRMHYLPEGHFMHQLLARGAVTHADVDRIVETLAGLYEAQAPAANRAAWGRVDALKISTDENFAQVEPALGAALSAPALATIKGYTRRFYAQHAADFNIRRQAGRIVDGHGDLHLEHIHITPEAVQIYDCIEFNDRLRYIDVASDVAFLAMDLDYNGRPDVARYFVDRMAQRLQDPGLLQMLDFYKCYRAFVRGKVAYLTGTEAEVPAEERAARGAEARRYFQRALHYAVTGSGPMVLVVMGRIGTGKSTQAAALAEALGWAHVSSDRVRKAQVGIDAQTRTPAADRPRVYAPTQTRRTYQTLTDQALRRAAQGEGTVLDATFGNRTHRDALRAALQAQQIPYVLVELTAPPAAIQTRLAERAGGDGAVSDARLDDWPRLNARYTAPDDLEDPFHFRVDTAADATEVTRQILDHVSCLRHSGAPANA